MKNNVLKSGRLIDLFGEWTLVDGFMSDRCILPEMTTQDLCCDHECRKWKGIVFTEAD